MDLVGSGCGVLVCVDPNARQKQRMKENGRQVVGQSRLVLITIKPETSMDLDYGASWADNYLLIYVPSFQSQLLNSHKVLLTGNSFYFFCFVLFIWMVEKIVHCFLFLQFYRSEKSKFIAHMQVQKTSDNNIRKLEYEMRNSKQSTNSSIIIMTNFPLLPLNIE